MKYKGLDKKSNRINIQSLLDFDYLDKLTDKEKEYLSQFAQEYYSADFRGDKPIHKKKHKKKIYNSNNARNRDTLSLVQAFGMLDQLEEKTSAFDGEEYLNTKIDLLKKIREDLD